MSRGFRLEAVLLVRDMCAAPKAGSPGWHLMLSVADFDMWLDVRSWHLADISGWLGACPLSWVKQTSPTPAPTSAYDPKRTFTKDVATVGISEETNLQSGA